MKLKATIVNIAKRLPSGEYDVKFQPAYYENGGGNDDEPIFIGEQTYNSQPYALIKAMSFLEQMTKPKKKRKGRQ